MLNGLQGAVYGGIFGGISGGIAGGVKAGIEGSNFWTGSMPLSSSISVSESFVSAVSEQGYNLAPTSNTSTSTSNGYYVYYVYDLRGDIRYIGITRRTPYHRFSEHLRLVPIGQP